MARLFALKHCFAHITTPDHTSSIVPRGPKMNSKLLSRFSDACKNWHCPFSAIPSAPGTCSNPTLWPHCWSHCSGKCASLFCLPSLSSAPNGPFLQPPSGSHCTDPISSLKLPSRQHPAWMLSPCRTVTTVRPTTHPRRTGRLWLLVASFPQYLADHHHFSAISPIKNLVLPSPSGLGGTPVFKPPPFSRFHSLGVQACDRTANSSLPRAVEYLMSA